jgi:photosystem II stability/assembly factor-like uncharacterized protein
VNGKQINNSFVITGLLAASLVCISGCFPERVVTDPDYVVQDVTRPRVEYKVPLNKSTDVGRSAQITVWFDELVDTISVQENLEIWSVVSISSVDAIAIDPQTPGVSYAAMEGRGIFKSTDGALTWQWMTLAQMHVNFTDMAVSPANADIIYAATADSGIYKSNDGGISWEQLNTGLLDLAITALAISPEDDDIVYLATNSAGLFKSENGGASWYEINDGVRTSKTPRDISINPLEPQTIYVATNGDKILKSTNGGTHWDKLSSGFFTFNFNSVAVHPIDTSVVFASSFGGGIYKSVNAGANWILMNQGLFDLNLQTIELHPQDTSIVLTNTSGTVYRSNDGGANWSTIGDIPAGVVIASLTIDPHNTASLLATTSGGIYHSGDFGNTWVITNQVQRDKLLITGDLAFSSWQGADTVIAFVDSVTLDTTIIKPYVVERGIRGWDGTGDPPIEPNPAATKLVITPDDLFPPLTKIQVRIIGSFEDDKETLRDSYGAGDLNGNTFESDYNFTFTTGRH